ncbi:MAG: hypothetical protein NVS2B3_18970 [Vulcanimicrobiaceae bacterium]
MIPQFARTIHHVDDFADRVLAALQDRSIRAAEACFVVSDVWRTRVAARFERLATVVGNGVDLARFVPISPSERRAVRARFGVAGEPLYLTIGGVEERKNTTAILEAFAEVRRARPDARLVVAGGASVFDHGAYRRAFATRAEALGIELGRSVVLPGVVADPEMPQPLAAADALVFPSLAEGFGLVLLEALACDVPVVTSRIAPFTEYLDDASAVLVDPHDRASIAAGMHEAVGSERRERRIAAGRAVARGRTWERVARTHIASYQETIRARNELPRALAR